MLSPSQNGSAFSRMTRANPTSSPARFALHSKRRQETRHLRIGGLPGHEFFHGGPSLPLHQVDAVDQLLDGVGDHFYDSRKFFRRFFPTTVMIDSG